MLQPYHPWRALRALAHVTLRWERLPDEVRGYTEPCGTEIVLDVDLTQAERRSTLTHELIHVEDGLVPEACDGYEERRVRLLAARRLITFDALVDAMLWATNEWELAEELWVDEDTVVARIEGLTDTERRELNERLDRAEEHLPIEERLGGEWA